MQNESSEERKKQPEDRTELLQLQIHWPTTRPQKPAWEEKAPEHLNRQDISQAEQFSWLHRQESLWQQLPLVASDILLICVPLILEDVRRGISGKLCHKCPFSLKNKEFAKYLGVVVGELKCHQGTEREVSVEKYWKVCCNRGSFMLQLAPSFSNLTLQSHKLNWGAQKVLHSIE